MFIIFLFIFSTHAYSVIDIDQNSIKEMAQSNLEVINYQERLQSAEALKGKLVRSFLPKISINYGQEKFDTGNFKNVTQAYGGIQAELNLFNSGKDKLEDLKINKEAQLASFETQYNKAHIHAELRKSLSHYAYLLEVKAILKLANDQNEKNLQSANKRIKAGLSTNTDTLDFKQQKIQIEQEVSNIEYEIRITHRLINTLIGVNPNEKTNIKFQNEHPEHANELKLNPENKSILVQMSDLQTEISQLELNKIKRWWGPTIDFYTYAKRFTEKEKDFPNASDRNDFTFGFNLTIPLFDGGDGIQNTQAAKSILRAQKAKQKLKEIELAKDNQDSVEKLQLAHQLIHGAEESIKIMSEYRLGVLEEYGKGVKNSPDVLQANQRWLESQTRYAELKKNYQFAKADSEYLHELEVK